MKKLLEERTDFANASFEDVDDQKNVAICRARKKNVFFQTRRSQDVSIRFGRDLNFVTY